MRKVAIVVGDILTPLGDLQETWEKMIAGQSGLHRQQLGGSESVYPVGLIDGLAGEGGSWERLQSLFDRLFANLPLLPPDTSLYIATTKAAVDEHLVPVTQAAGQPWKLADHLKNRLSLNGETSTVSAACASGTLALIQGAMNIAAGNCDKALVVGIDLVAKFILTGFDSLKALSPGGARPFDRNRDGLSLGDGAGWMLLSSAGGWGKSTGEPLAWLAGWGVSCDATHITAPCRQASGLKRVLDQVLAGAGMPLGGINAHGTGTVYNDAMELLAFQDKCPEVPICSVKGAIGHSLGAAGVVEAVLSVKSLHTQHLPPTVGLQELQDESANMSGLQALALRSPSILSSNSGFGGINAAVLLTR